MTIDFHKSVAVSSELSSVYTRYGDLPGNRERNFTLLDLAIVSLHKFIPTKTLMGSIDAADHWATTLATRMSSGAQFHHGKETDWISMFLNCSSVAFITQTTSAIVTVTCAPQKNMSAGQRHSKAAAAKKPCWAGESGHPGRDPVVTRSIRHHCYGSTYRLQD